MSRNTSQAKKMEAHDLMYFKIYKSQLPVIERALHTAALMLDAAKSRGYCLEMICAGLLGIVEIGAADPWLVSPA